MSGKLTAETIESLKEATALVETSMSQFLANQNAETAKLFYKACKSYSNRYEGRVMKLKAAKPAKQKKKATKNKR